VSEDGGEWGKEGEEGEEKGDVDGSIKKREWEERRRGKIWRGGVRGEWREDGYSGARRGGEVGGGKLIRGGGKRKGLRGIKA